MKKAHPVAEWGGGRGAEETAPPLAAALGVRPSAGLCYLLGALQNYFPRGGPGAQVGRLYPVSPEGRVVWVHWRL